MKVFDNPSILLNGIGNATNYNPLLTPLSITQNIPEPYTIYFNNTKVPGRPPRYRRYLLRLINVSFASSFIVTIDNHQLQVVTADFVPINPYPTNAVMVAIGQRYHVIVEANPHLYENEHYDNGNFWIRTYQAGCTDFGDDTGANYSQVGILRYTDATIEPPNSPPTATPCTKRITVSSIGAHNPISW